MPRLIHDLKTLEFPVATRNRIEDAIEKMADQIELRTGLSIPSLPVVEMFIQNQKKRPGWDPATELCSVCKARLNVGIHVGEDGFELHWRDDRPVAELVRGVAHALSHLLLYHYRSTDRSDWVDKVRTAEDSPTRDVIRIGPTDYEILRVF